VKLYRVKEAATLLAMSERKVWQLIHDGELPAIRIGRSTRVEDAAIAALIRTGRDGAQPDGQVEMSTAAQRGAIGVKSRGLEAREELEPGQGLTRIKKLASERFGREIASTRELTRDEASDLLDELAEDGL
jgi:excisionase family DNA binding protein